MHMTHLRMFMIFMAIVMVFVIFSILRYGVTPHIHASLTTPHCSLAMQDRTATWQTRSLHIVCVVALLGVGGSLLAHGFYRAFEETKVR